MKDLHYTDPITGLEFYAEFGEVDIELQVSAPDVTSDELLYTWKGSYSVTPPRVSVTSEGENVADDEGTQVLIVEESFEVHDPMAEQIHQRILSVLKSHIKNHA